MVLMVLPNETETHKYFQKHDEVNQDKGKCCQNHKESVPSTHRYHNNSNYFH